MRLKNIETTPNPNSMKLNLDEQIGAAVTYTAKSNAGCPEFVERLLEIAGVRSVFACQDFITLNKDPRADWHEILASATVILSGESLGVASVEVARKSAESEGQSHVYVQTFRGVPIQVKVVDSGGETRLSLGARFNETAQSIQADSGADFLVERYWADYGARYGSRGDVAAELVDEIEGTFSSDVLQRIRAHALDKSVSTSPEFAVVTEWLKSEDWHQRLMAVQELGRSAERIDMLACALKDAHPQVRRLAAAALGASGNPLAVEPLCDALLQDPAVGVRRTAGDALSDIGEQSAQAAMCHALSDSNKLVRWRAARFLADMGTQDALPYLEKAAADAEFEVRLEVESAVQRIRGGAEGLGPAWKRIVERN